MDKRITKITLRGLLRSLGDLLLPRECVVCGRQLLPQEEHLCVECEADLPLTHFENLLHNPMADAFNGQVEASGYDRAVALFYYRGDYRKITQALKYGRNFSLGRRAARELGRRMAAGGLFADVDVVCPVPLHWTRRWRRGYNQASIIAREVANELQRAAPRHSRPALESPSPARESPSPARESPSPALESPSPARESPSPARFAPRLLRRVRRTGTQTRLASEARSANVSGAFTVNRSVIPDLIGNPKMSFLIVDDVFTTGATLASCHAALRAAFGPAVRISVATLAFVD